MEEAVFHIHRALEETHWWFVARQRIVGRLIERVMADRQKGLIVDVGCGTGGTIATLSGHYRCMGLDASPLAIRLAREKFPEQTFRLGLMPQDLEDVADQAALYLLMDVLEHVPNDRKFLADLVGLARPGAEILVTVPADPRLWSQHDETAGHLRRYDKKDLMLCWQGLPVQVRLISYFNARLYPAIRLARQAGKWLGGPLGREGTDFRQPPAVINSWLADVFGGEAERLDRCLDNPSLKAYRSGVSLIALLKRLE